MNQLPENRAGTERRPLASDLLTDAYKVFKVFVSQLHVALQHQDVVMVLIDGMFFQVLHKVPRLQI